MEDQDKLDNYGIDNIYSIVPKIEEHKSNLERRFEISKYLITNRDRWYKANELTRILKFPRSSTSVVLRLCITYLIEVDKIPIISSGRGFMYSEDINKIKEYVELLEKRIQGIERRIKGFDRIILQG